MPEDRRPTGIVAKLMAQGTFACPMKQVREVVLGPGGTWTPPDAAHAWFLHLAAGRLEGLPPHASVLMPAGGHLRAGRSGARLTTAPVAFRHEAAGDPLLRLTLPIVLGDAAAQAAWLEIAATAAAARAGDGWQRIRCRGLVLAALGSFLGTACLAGRLQRSPRPQPGWLSSCLTHLRRRVADRNLAVADLAATARLSPDAFGRAFRTATGETPWAMVLRLRISLAESLLRNGHSVKGAAARSGFATASRLIAAFRRIHGMPPGAWVRLSATV